MQLHCITNFWDSRRCFWKQGIMGKSWFVMIGSWPVILLNLHCTIALVISSYFCLIVTINNIANMFAVLFARLEFESVVKTFRFHYIMLLIIHDTILTTMLLHSIENIKMIQRTFLFCPQLQNVNAKGENYKLIAVSVSRILVKRGKLYWM